MTLNLFSMPNYTRLHRCSYIIYKILIYFYFYLFKVHVTNLVIISLKMVYSFNPFTSLIPYVLILETSVVNTFAEIMDSFRLSNNVQINNKSIYYANNALY